MTITVSDAIAAAAFLFGLVNFVWAATIALQNRKRRLRDDVVRISQLLDDAFDLLYGPQGFEATKDKYKLLEAEKKIEKALLIDPDNPRAVDYDGDLFWLVGNKERALARYQRSAQLDPTRPRPHDCIGSLSEDGEAKKSFEHAISLAKDRPALYYYRLACLSKKQKNLAEAESYALKALKERPEYADAFCLLGDIADKPAEAQRRYEQAITVEPNHINALVGLGRVLCQPKPKSKEGKPETPETFKEGIDWLEHAHRLHPRNTFPLCMMAAIYADIPLPDKAIQYAEKAVAIDPREKFEGQTTRDLLNEMRGKLSDGAIHFSCPNCHKKLRAAESAAGKSTKCPTCGAAVPIPTASEAPAAEHPA